ncbi:MAG: GTPase [Clostridia bacterium]|nr:GTPase [Clostridia bacterium]
MQKDRKEVEVLIVLGFLDSGKTTFLQETMEDERTDDGGCSLLLVCEEGETEYDESKFKVRNFDTVSLGDKSELTEQNLTRIDREKKPTQVFVEYNGMWDMNSFFDAMPENWVIVSVLTLFDTSTFLTYNANMRSLVYDKISITQLVVLNRFKAEYEKEEYHKILRAISRRMDIIYEDETGKTEADDIVDPLPYDVTAPVIKIDERDYAYFYRDIVENPDTYDGKTVKFKAMAEVRKSFPAGMILIGRHIMTCCQADIAYNAFALTGKKLPGEVKAKDWLTVTARVSYGTCPLYSGEGPMMEAVSVSRAEAPEDVVATFY